MTDLSVLSASEAVKFLRWLDPDGRHNLVALDPAGVEAPEAASFDFSRKDMLPVTAAQEFIEGHNGHRNLYFSINEPREDARLGTKLRRDEIGAVRAFHVDIDQLEGAPDWDFDCLPSAVIDSGGGKWGLWKLAQKIPADDVPAIEAQNRALTARFHGDTQAHNLDRIARLPGTLNIPNAAKRKKGRTDAPARIVSMGGPVWEPQEVAQWCPPLQPEAAAAPKADQEPLAELDTPANVARAAKWLMLEAGEAVEGENGNAATYAVAAKLKDFGVSQAVAFELLLDCWNETKASPPWDARELRDITKNAYAYGTAAPGRNAPTLAESEFGAVDLGNTEGTKPLKRKMTFEPCDSVTEDFNAEPNFLIEGWYDREAMIVTYGESNSGKTHVVLDQAMAIASGRSWGGKQTRQGLVVYVAAEGGKGVRRRVMAHRLFRPEHKNVPVALVSYPINLMHQNADAKTLVALVKDAESHYGQKCVMVVVDTLSRALAGGDENSSADMGAFVKRCDEIRAATGAALHVVHHAGKNTAKGARGHSLLRAAVDTEIEIESNTIIGRKQRDMEVSRELRFDYKPVLLGRQAGRDVVSVVLEVWETTEFSVERTPTAQGILDKIQAIITQKAQKGGVPDSLIVTPRELVAMRESEIAVERGLRELVGTGDIVKCRRGLYKLNTSLIPS